MNNYLEIAIRGCLSLEPSTNLINVTSSIRDKKELKADIKMILEQLAKIEQKLGFATLKLTDVEYKIISLFIKEVDRSVFDLETLNISYIKENIKINEFKIDLAINSLEKKGFFGDEGVVKVIDSKNNFVTLTHEAIWRTDFLSKKSDNNYSFNLLLMAFLKYIKENLDMGVDSFDSEQILIEISLEEYMLNCIFAYIVTEGILDKNKTLGDGRRLYHTRFSINKTKFLSLFMEMGGVR